MGKWSLAENREQFFICDFREEDYKEDEKSTKKAKLGTKGFRSYQPVSEVLPGGTATAPLDIIENEIAEHLEVCPPLLASNLLRSDH